SGHFQRLLLHFRLSAGGLSLPASRSHRTERGGLVQSRRQGGVSTPRGRYGRKEGKARDPRREARVPDDQDPAQRYDRQRAFGERREGGAPEGDRRGHGQGRRQGAHGRRHAEDCGGEDDGEGGHEDRDQGAGEEGSGEEARREEEGDRRREVSSWAVLAAAGSGERLGADRPKAFVRLGDRVLLAESVERL